MKVKYYILVCGLLSVISCQKKLFVKDDPDFSVWMDGNTTTYKVGTPVSFNLQGDADVVSFYSGEVFRDYAFKDGRQVNVAGLGLNLSFNSAVAPGSPTGTQVNQFSVLASTNFNGDYSALAKVKSATWTEITDRFELGTNSAFKVSTRQDISDLLTAGKPIYFALKYVNKPQIANGYGCQWMVESFTLTSNDSLNNAPIIIADNPHLGFRVVDENPVNAPARSTVTSSRTTLYGPVYKNPNDPIYDPNNPIFDPKNPIYDPASPQFIPNAQVPVFVAYDPNSPYNDPQSENWAISAPITVGNVDLGNDKPVAVTSGIYLTNPKVFKYTYKNIGTYKAYFIASNNTIDQSKEVIKEITITITE